MVERARGITLGGERMNAVAAVLDAIEDRLATA